MSSTLKEFINQQRPSVLNEFSQVIVETTPLLPPNQVPTLTAEVFDYYTRLILAELKPGDEFVRTFSGANRKLGVTPELGRLRAKKYFSLLKKQLELEASFDVEEKNHFERMFEQSERFLLTISIMLNQSNVPTVANDETN